ncbi:putative DNA primase [Candidatus Carsonella ruddii CS isolate Thao2000]|uniref:Putative DNA primase n=1 Tax=Candidatus Carsonella ruddii CS isolate Thao2000 TaxID=1202537 RepID=J7H0A6_CARRU|nr:toprim domain-containing protein [Candidatus Carsonella ruddii]AFP83730.1 putative DNA primase [Candidatus Carsonella ruddii CS isolate Thao2000]
MNFLCPFHLDKNSSFSIKKNTYYCYGCNLKGKIIFENIKMNKFEFYFNKEILLKAKIYLIKKKNFWLNYLSIRNIDFKTLFHYNLGCIDINFKTKNNVYFVKNKLIFPIIDEFGLLCGIGLKTNNLKSKYVNIYKKNYNNKNVIYGINESINRYYTIIVEGYFDLLTLYKNNIYNATSVLGCNVNYKKIIKLLLKYKSIYFCFDGDLAGYLSVVKINKIKNKYKIKNLNCINLPFGYDPDNYINKYGIENFFKFMNI